MMGAVAGNVLNVAYVDVLRSTGGTDSVEDVSRVGGGTTGTIDITPSIRPGNNLIVTVTDPDLDIDALVTETVSVVAVNLATGESETLTLTETSQNSGIFQATPPLQTIFGATAGVDNDLIMQVKSGDIVEVQYNDALDATGQPAVVTDQASVGAGDDGTLTITGAVVPGGELSVSVSDAWSARRAPS